MKKFIEKMKPKTEETAISKTSNPLQTNEEYQVHYKNHGKCEISSASQPTGELMSIGSSCHVNRELIPVKINYFSQFFVISALFIYLNPILAQSGLSASQLGLTALVTNALVTCARLISGPIMDRTKKKNRIIVVLSVVTAAVTLCFLVLPKEREYVMEGQFNENGFFKARVYPDKKIADDDFGPNYSNHPSVCWPAIASECYVVDKLFDRMNEPKFNLVIVSENETKWTALYSIHRLLTSPAHEGWTNKSTANNTVLYCSHLLPPRGNDSKCIPIQNERIKAATYLTVAMGLVLRTVVSCSHAPILNLLESITFGILGPGKSRFFGQTRLVGSLGFIIGALVTGVAINQFSRNSNRSFVRFASIDPNDRSTIVNYTPSILVGVSFAVISAFSTPCIKQSSDRCRLKIHKAILVAFRSTEMSKCMLSCVLIGFVLSLVSEYFTLILTTEYGVSHTFLGLIMSVIVVTEVPMFFVSGSLVSRFGPSLCVSIACFVWTVYFGTIAFVSNPWAILGAHAWSGLAFPLANNAILYQAALVGRDRSLNVDGNLVASMQAITSAISFGLIPCFGGFIWGILLDYLPGRYLFAVAGCYTSVVMICVPSISVAINRLCSK
ncbi:hypothetical protein FGIG_03770 [Fasciola gigantica]|uniref:Major facilitator superfamily associated domain-containing protein n=1 Tax=Fasciola gigantica TaxID=46835 RepID=A0A504Y9G7_FASGI|nr:hypothetical protein FGIG_03770 [Fasciola gigantica]